HLMINFFSSAWVQCIGLGTSNVAGHTKKAIYAAATLIAYSVFCLTRKFQFFLELHWHHDLCFVVCFLCAEILRFILARENKKRENDAQELEDFTDRENKSFRYISLVMGNDEHFNSEEYEPCIQRGIFVTLKDTGDLQVVALPLHFQQPREIQWMLNSV
ncbi:hypothetical protein C8A01DRAFT_15075, partial [Parachaetomium inaequale]